MLLSLHVHGHMYVHIRKQVEEGELEPVEQSDWASPIVVVKKKDGGLRVCAEYIH